MQDVGKWGSNSVNMCSILFVCEVRYSLFLLQELDICICRVKGAGTGGEKITVCFSAGGVRGVDVYSDDWSRGDGPTQE